MYNYLTSFYTSATEKASSKQDPKKNDGQKNGGELLGQKSNSGKDDELSQYNNF